MNYNSIVQNTIAKKYVSDKISTECDAKLIIKDESNNNCIEYYPKETFSNITLDMLLSKHFGDEYYEKYQIIDENNIVCRQVFSLKGLQSNFADELALGSVTLILKPVKIKQE